MSVQGIGPALEIIRSQIAAAVSRRPQTISKPVRLVAVSKLHGKEAVLEAYRQGQHIFGENYVQELVDKATDADVIRQCPDIKWHFIGHLQSNKVNRVMAIPNLDVIETVDSQKLAVIVDRSRAAAGKTDKLKVFVQVNTSDEDNKSGLDADHVVDLIRFMQDKCQHLHVMGLMTIGAYGYDTSRGPNPDFLKLTACRDQVCQEFSLDPNDLELSMGMSTDFEHAIELGSTNVRIGTTIFGTRPSK